MFPKRFAPALFGLILSGLISLLVAPLARRTVSLLVGGRPRDGGPPAG